MKGLVKLDITISNRNLKYYLELQRKITIISGSSGTGKSVLRDFIEVYNNDES